MVIETLYTIGVYGSTESAFFDTLVNAHVDLFVDIRQRRGVRGKTYAYANSTYLQNKLKALNIDYLHYPSLAPTSEIRQAQYKADAQTKTDKRKRETLAPVFIETYKKEILSQLDFADFLRNCENCKNICLFCVEQRPEACHRSIVAVKLMEFIDTRLIHLML